MACNVRFPTELLFQEIKEALKNSISFHRSPDKHNDYELAYNLSIIMKLKTPLSSPDIHSRPHFTIKS